MESSEKETKEKKEREAKQAKDMADLVEKLKTSNQRIKTLAAKSKAYESEAVAIDKVIFRKGFSIFPPSLPLSSQPIPGKLITQLVHVKQRVSDLNGRWSLLSAGLKHVKKCGIPLTTSLRLVAESPGPYP
jgi:hypothetical protein